PGGGRGHRFTAGCGRGGGRGAIRWQIGWPAAGPRDPSGRRRGGGCDRLAVTVSTLSPPPSERKNLLLPEQERWPLDPTRPVIQLVDVSIAFGDKQVLRGLNLEIVPGKTTVIVGRSGSGKSVLLKLMMGLLRPDSGQVILFGRDLATVSPVEILELRKRMSMLFQNYALCDALPA